MNTLRNKTVLITGAAGGIGLACVEEFLEAGARVVATDVPDKPPRALRPTARRHYVAADLRDPAAIQTLVAQAAEHFRGLDVLVNNAATFTPMTPAHQTTLEEFDLLISVNLRAAWLCFKHAYPHLKRTRGSVVNVSSMAGVAGEAGHAIYTATKGGLNALTKSIAIDYGPQGIRCNAVCPSSVLTPGSDKLFMHLPQAARIVAYRKNINHLRITAQPDQIASVVVFLASPAASFITGAIVPVSGGSECGYGDKRPPV